MAFSESFASLPTVAIPQKGISQDWKQFPNSFVLIMVALELIYALALNPVSPTSHFGGMAGGAVLVLGLWRPSRWKKFFQKKSLERKKRKIEAELRVIQGGKQDDDNNGNNGSSGPIWN